MPTFETLPRFEWGWKKLAAQQQATFREVVTESSCPTWPLLIAHSALGARQGRDRPAHRLSHAVPSPTSAAAHQLG
jgi:hypothetical protein